MELFLLIAIGITVISFISIALNKPSQASIEDSLPESATAEITKEEDAMPHDAAIELNNELNEISEHNLIEEKVVAPMA